MDIQNDNKKASIKLTEKFINGLKNHNLTLEDIQNGDWKYCGGNMGRHFNYFKLFFGHNKIPDKLKSCICGHDIIENCYITNDIEIIILGNCCIKKFIPNSTRTCEKCNAPHKNRVCNRCNICRIGICDSCNKSIRIKYKKCYNCRKN